MDDLGKLKEQGQAGVEGANDPAALEGVRVDLLGKKGRITSVMKGLGGLVP